MKVKQLKMTSFRGIDNLTLDFNTAEPTVFIGINGAGKSRILKCIALFLSSLTMRVLNSSKSIPSVFSEQDISNGHQQTQNEITISFDEFGDVPLLTGLIRGKPGDDPPSYYSNPPDGPFINDFQILDRLVYRRLQVTPGLLDNPEANIPIAIYYPTNRTVPDTSLESAKEYPFFQINAYEGAITGGKIDFADFFEWFKTREDLENELRLNNNPDYRNPQLEAVRQAITSFLPGFSNLRVRRSPLRMTLIKQGQELIVNQLSDGEKCLLAMVGDLARRLAIANPGLPDPLQGSGVVLIDEIELHLHPSWQREIIPALTRTFPNCQFIVTTHSPQVISAVKPESIYILEVTAEGIVAKRPESSFGRDSNRILEDLMGVPERPQKIKDRLRDLFRLIDEGNLSSAQQMRRQLAEEIGVDEPSFVRADVLIRRKEILNQ